jgi:hypothetical protein
MRSKGSPLTALLEMLFFAACTLVVVRCTSSAWNPVLTVFSAGIPTWSVVGNCEWLQHMGFVYAALPQSPCFPTSYVHPQSKSLPILHSAPHRHMVLQRISLVPSRLSTISIYGGDTGFNTRVRWVCMHMKFRHRDRTTSEIAVQMRERQNALRTMHGRSRKHGSKGRAATARSHCRSTSTLLMIMHATSDMLLMCMFLTCIFWVVPEYAYGLHQAICIIFMIVIASATVSIRHACTFARHVRIFVGLVCMSIALSDPIIVFFAFSCTMLIVLWQVFACIMRHCVQHLRETVLITFICVVITDPILTFVVATCTMMIAPVLLVTNGAKTAAQQVSPAGVDMDDSMQS